jgi:hypothetical protein
MKKNNISFFFIYQCAIRVAQDDKDGGRLGGSKKKMKRYQRMFSSSFKTVKVDSIIDGRNSNKLFKRNPSRAFPRKNLVGT